jgi:hypothetical protein
VEDGLRETGPFEAAASLLDYRRRRSIALARSGIGLSRPTSSASILGSLCASRRGPSKEPIAAGLAEWIYNHRLQSRIANTTIVVIEFH